MEFCKDECPQESLNTFVRAFNLSWNYLERHAVELLVSGETAREFLKLIIVELAEAGESNPVRIADLAIARMRKLGHESREGADAWPSFGSGA